MLPALLFAAMVCCAPRVEAKMTYQLNDTIRSGFDALGHVLQKPLGNPVFENKRFGDHLFLSGGAGVSMSGLHARPGVSMELSIGDWVTPVHGWRVGFGIGNRSIKKGYPDLFFGRVSADYLLNFTSLLRGYRQGRTFELIGAIGAEYRRLKSDGVWGNEFGLRASLQGRFNVSHSLFLYLEPRLTLSAGSRYKSMIDDYRRFCPDLSFNVGLGYRLLQGVERTTGTTDFFNIEDNHLFFGAGGGAVSFLRGADRSTIDWGTQFYIGKWLSSVAGLRAKWQFGRYILPGGEPGHRYIATGSLDYVWNISSAFGGYRPDEVFGLELNLGVAGAYADNAKGRLYPGLEGGLTATFRLSPNWSLYVEPQLQVFTRRFSRDAGKGFAISPMGSVMGGLRYTIGNFAHDFPESYEEYAKARNYFLTISGAPAWRLRGDYGTGFMASAGFGKRFTPVSSWRLTADGSIFSHTPKFVSLSLSADYLFSISTSMAGFNPYRVFDLSGVVGVTGGIAHYGPNPIKPLIGAKAGLHGSFRLSDALDLYVEPVLVATRVSAGITGWTPEVRVMAGLAYRLGRGASFGEDAVYASPLEGSRNFVSVSAGPTLFSGNFNNRRVNGAVDASVGRWFTLVSGLRCGMTYDFIPDENMRRRMNMGSVHADYLLNITSLITRDEMRRFHIIGLLGGGVSFSDVKYSRAGLMLETGMQFRYNLPFNVDVHLEPNASFVMNRVMPNYRNNSRFSVVTRLMAGVSYRF